MTPRPEDIPMLFPDPVIAVYMKDVDRTLIRSMLQKTPTERVLSLMEMGKLADAGKRSRERARCAGKAI